MNKKNRSILTIVGVSVLLAGLLIGLFKDAIIKNIICSQVESQIGVSIAIDRLHYNPFKTSIRIDGLKLANPKEFGGGDAFHVKRIYIDTSLSEVMSEEPHLDVCEIDIERMRLVSAGSGASNIEVLADRFESAVDAGKSGKNVASGKNEAGAVSGDEESSGSAKDDKEITIGYLKIHLGKIQMETETFGGRKIEPKEYVVDQTFEYRDVDDLDPVAQQILMVVAVKSGPNMLKDLKNLLEENKDDLEKIGDDVKETADKLRQELKDLF